MLILGVTGGFKLPYESSGPALLGANHDAAVVLIDNGKVKYGIEEERLSRISHTGNAPFFAIQSCLNRLGIKLSDIDKIAVSGSENFLTNKIRQNYLLDPKTKVFRDARAEYHRMCQLACGADFDDEKLVFVHHHLAHAMSAFFGSGYEQSLVLTLDCFGDDISGQVLDANYAGSNPLKTFSISNSLGQYYLDVSQYLGYGWHEEGLVSGLAPSGNPVKYQSLFKAFYSLLPEGDYRINTNYIPLLHSVVKPRKQGEPITQVHQDIAASLQQSLTEIVLHVLRYSKTKTKHANLCLAGGVFQNWLLNGKILSSGIFENMFVQPAANNAGASLGAALEVYHQANRSQSSYRIGTVDWGTDIGDHQIILETLNKWQEYLEFESKANIAATAAQLLAEGKVIGWVQGKSEFGPHSLGNRSIVADPRSEKYPELIGKMLEKPAPYPPLTVSILEEFAGSYFEVPTNKPSFPFANIALKVRLERQLELKAASFKDGTVQAQTVSNKSNPLFWELLEEFRKITGIPHLVNTSFHNGAEPLVDSVNDAIVSFLTTGLDYLVIGDFLLRRKKVDAGIYLKLIPTLPQYVLLKNTQRYCSFSEKMSTLEILFNHDPEKRLSREITPEVFQILKNSDDCKTLGELISFSGATTSGEMIVAEIIKLWASRFVILHPSE